MSNKAIWRTVATVGLSLPFAAWAVDTPDAVGLATHADAHADADAQLRTASAQATASTAHTRVALLRIAQTLQADGSSVERRETHTRILHGRGLGRAGQVRLVYQPARETLNIVQAFVLQADGQQRPAPEAEQLPADDGNPDRAVLAVRFPDLKVGETTVLVVERKLTQPLFEGQFSWQEIFHPATFYDDVQVRLDTPATLRTQVHATALQALPAEVKAGRRVQRWQWRQQPAPTAVVRQNFSVLDLQENPGLIVSTFRSYADIARAYGRLVGAQLRPSEQVKALAREKTAGLRQPRERVDALARWVSTHIAEEGECLGQGRAAPRAPAEVLASQTGNCTDQATLLQALLAAVGIESTQALLNGGNIYRLPQVPTESALNHVLNVVPSLNMYVDPTADNLAPGDLSFEASGKPAFWVKAGPKDARTPLPSVGSNRQVMHSRFDVQPDGAVHGQVEVQLQGRFARDSRNHLGLVPEEVIEQMVPLFFRGIKRTATGTFTTDDLKSTASKFQFQARFETEPMLPAREGGAFKIEPLFYSERPVADYFLASRQDIEPQASVTCDHAHTEEHYTYTFPAGVRVAQVPANVQVSTPVGRYQARYELRGQVLHAHRILTDLTPGPICTPAQQVATREFARRASADENAQVVLERVSP